MRATCRIRMTSPIQMRRVKPLKNRRRAIARYSRNSTPGKSTRKQQRASSSRKRRRSSRPPLAISAGARLAVRRSARARTDGEGTETAIRRSGARAAPLRRGGRGDACMDQFWQGRCQHRGCRCLFDEAGRGADPRGRGVQTMKPIEFLGQTTIFAKDQPEYQPLPAHVDSSPQKIVTTCWELTAAEVGIVRLTKRIWLQQYSFGQALPPQLPSVSVPEQIHRGPEKPDG